jgi:hypothetical protein
LTLGDTFYFINPGAHRHLWVVTGGPSAGGDFAIFNLTSVRTGCDTSCVLDVGDHPIITHPTYITYLRGRELPRSLGQSHAHLFSWQPRVGPTVLTRIQHGALASKFTAEKLKKIVRETLASGADSPNP